MIPAGTCVTNIIVNGEKIKYERFDIGKTTLYGNGFLGKHAGATQQITIIFTRRQLNIETLSVSPSALKGIHKFTITVETTRDIIEKVVKQIDKRIDVLKAYYNVDEELVSQEIALYKLSTEKVMEMGSVESLIRRYNVRIRNKFQLHRC